MRGVFALFLALGCAALAFSQPFGAPPSELNVRMAASRGAVDKAVRALESGDTEGALEASDEARFLDASNADASYLLAVSKVRAGRPLADAEGELRLALAGGTFFRYSADDAARLLAHILVSTKRYPEALRLVARPGLAGDSDALYLRVRALRFLGDSEGFFASVDAGLDRFPSDARIPRELLAFAARTPRTEAVASRVLRVEGRLGFYRYLDPELLLLLAPFRTSAEARRDTVLEYRALGRRSPRASVLALELGILDDRPAVKEFLGFKTLAWEDLRALRAGLRSEEGRAAFADTFSRYTGELGYDSDGDGLFETQTTFRDGEIMSWILDFNQDGNPETTLAFRDSLPESGRMVLAGAEASFEYGEYPYLARTRYLASDGVREYLFSPDALVFPVVELYSGPGRESGEGFLPRRTGITVPVRIGLRRRGQQGDGPPGDSLRGHACDGNRRRHSDTEPYPDRGRQKRDSRLQERDTPVRTRGHGQRRAIRVKISFCR